MPLGVDQNNLAPQLIQSSGQALVQGIRQIGQQISGHLTELQTKRDLGAMAQDLQSINPQSTEFPVQLTQLISRHPLAARDERGQMALSVLGKAHGEWQATEAEARAFNRAMAMQTKRTKDARDTFDYETNAKLGMPQNVGGSLVIPKDPVTGEPNVLLPAPARGSAASPRTLAPGAILVDPTGKELARNPKVGITDYQKAQIRRADRRDKISAINKEIDQFDSNITSGERAYEAAFKRERDATSAEEKLQHQNDKTKIGSDTDALKAEKKRRLEELRKLREDDLADAAVLNGAAADDEAAAAADVLPTPGALPAAQDDPNALVPVINPSGKPTNIKRSQLGAALQGGYKQR